MNFGDIVLYCYGVTNLAIGLGVRYRLAGMVMKGG